EAQLRAIPLGRDETGYVIVQFKETVTPEMQRQLKELGALPLHFVHENAYITRVQGDAIEEIRRLPSVRWVGDFHPGYKLSPDLALEEARKINEHPKTDHDGSLSPEPFKPVDTREAITVRILTVEPDRVDSVAGAVAGLGGTNLHLSKQYPGLVRATVPRGR